LTPVARDGTIASTTEEKVLIGEMLVYVLRHADTVLGHDDVFRGRADVPLSQAGHAQAEALARRLSSVPLRAMFCGPLSRARSTAEAVAAPHGLEPIVEHGFDDIHIGDWEGLTLSEVATRWPDQWEKWRTAPESFVFPGGEDLSAVRARAWAALERAVHAIEAEAGRDSPASGAHAHPHPEGGLTRPYGRPAIAVVTHRAVAKLLVLEALGAPTSSFWRIYQNPCALNMLELRSDGNHTVYKVNDTSHLNME
jgi:broad specificity phosphatase PhoE